MIPMVMSLQSAGLELVRNSLKHWTQTMSPSLSLSICGASVRSSVLRFGVWMVNQPMDTSVIQTVPMPLVEGHSGAGILTAAHGGAHAPRVFS